MRKVSLEQAQEVHRKALIIDGHNDTLVERVHRGESPLQWMQRDPAAYNSDVPRMQEGGIDSAFFIVGDGLDADILVTMERTLAQIEEHPEDLSLVLRSGDIEQAHESGKVSVIMTIEGAAKWLDGEIDKLRLYYRLGLRAFGITHGEGGSESHFLQGSRSPTGLCSNAEREDARQSAQGLTDFGREAVAACNELGIVIDLAHINDRAFYEVLELSSRTPVMTHTAVCSRCPQWRCMTDDQIRALAGAGGVMGIAFVPKFIHPADPSVDRVVEHIRYVADLVGIDHVGIGTDFDGMGDMEPLVPDPTGLVRLTQAMLAHGLSEEEILKIWGGNFLRVLSENIG